MKLVVVTQSLSGKFKAYEIKEKPYEYIMNKLLLLGKIDEALAKMNDNILSTSGNKMEQIEKFFLDAAWVCIKQGNFYTIFLLIIIRNLNESDLDFDNHGYEMNEGNFTLEEILDK